MTRGFIRFAGVFAGALMLAIASPALGKEVEVRGVGVAPVIRDQASSRRVAMELAKRDAVERAIGAEVQASAIPAEELVRVVATTSGRLKFSVVSEEVEGEVYIVEILATVQIPPGLESKYPRSLEEERTGYKALIQKFPDGELNWRDGYLLARGLARKKGKDEKSMAQARRAAQVDAYGLALRMIAGINFDPEETVKQRMGKAPKIEYSLKGLIRGAEVVEEKSLDPRTYQVIIKVPLRGIKGIQRAFTETMNLQEPPRRVPPKEPDEEKTYTGIIVDVRGFNLVPALFPEIVDETGEAVYSLDMIDPKALTRRGPAAYVVGEKESPEGPKGSLLEPGRLLIVPALAVECESPCPASAKFASSELASLLSFSHPVKIWQLMAQMLRRKLVLRQGPRPIRITAIKKAGPTRSRIVISNASATRIRKVVAYNDFLRSSRVVLITDSMIGGTEGKYWRQREHIPTAW